MRVAGVTGIDAVSRERIRQAAERIATATGLDVDITAGRLGRADRGRPARRAASGGRALALTETWVRPGRRGARAQRRRPQEPAAVRADPRRLRAVRHERGERGRARAPRRARRARLPRLVDRRGCSPSCSPRSRWSGSPPASSAGCSRCRSRRSSASTRRPRGPRSRSRRRRASRCSPGLVPARRAPRAPSRSPPSARRCWRSGAPGGRAASAGLALVNLVRTPGRTALGALSLAIGVCALTLLLAATIAFNDVLVGTLLGDAVAVQVRGTDYVAVIATVLLGVAAVADVLFLNLRERAGELATLEAGGWDDRALGRLVAFEGLWIGAARSARRRRRGARRRGAVRRRRSRRRWSSRASRRRGRRPARRASPRCSPRSGCAARRSCRCSPASSRTYVLPPHRDAASPAGQRARRAPAPGRRRPAHSRSICRSSGGYMRSGAGTA